MMNRHILLFCIVPTGGVAVIMALGISSGKTLAASPLLYPISGLCGLGAVSVFLAHFRKDVPNLFAWLTIVLNGALVILYFAGIHHAVGILGSGESTPSSHEFTTALYFSTVTFTTLGYGDFQPHPDIRLLAALEALLGYVYLGLTVGAAIDLGSRAPER